MKKAIFLFVAVVVSLLGAAPSADANSGYKDLFNARYGTTGSAIDTCTLCHTSAPALNPYGNDLAAHGFDFAAIEKLDSDADGFSNFGEINARTFPGDGANTPTAMPVPSSGILFLTVPPSNALLLNSDPVQIRPLAFGAIANGGSTFRVQAGFPQFGAPADIYIAISLGPDLYFLTPTGFVPFSAGGFVSWQSGVTGPIDQTIIPDVSSSGIGPLSLPFIVLVTPAGNLSHFYGYLSLLNFGLERNLQLHLQNMNPHINQLMEFRVVSNADNSLAARAIIDPLPAANFDITMRLGVPTGDYRLDFFADLSGNRTYNAPPADHAWRLTLPATGTADVTFVHNTTFTDISSPAPVEKGSFTLTCTNMTPHVGQLFEAHVIEVATGRNVGIYRLGSVPSANFSITIPGIIGDGVGYQVDFFADLNGSKAYNAPPVDHAWRLLGTGGPAGLTLTFAHNTNFTDVGF